jgi:acetyl-CoA carboxylase carboxyltransferase component
MGVLASRLDPSSDAYVANRAANLELLAELDRLLEQARAGGGQRYVDRHRARGKLLARERVELLLDRDGPFLELSPLAAWGTDFPVGASGVTGVGPVAGVECVVTASDPTVRGGATNPLGLKKTLRAMEIAERDRLPLVQLIESSGADLPTQSQIFIPGGAVFRNLARLSRAGVPTVALVFGSSTAGGAYVPGLSDHTIMVRERAKVFLGGPPLVRMATGEQATDEELGGAEMHAGVSGLADQLADDEHDCIRLGRQVIADLGWRKLGPGPTRPADEPVHDPEELLGLAPVDLKVPADVREILARWSTAPGSRSGSRGTAPTCAAAGRRSTATRWGSWRMPAGCCSRRSPTRRPTSSSSPTRGPRRCCSSRTPPASWSARPTSSGGSSRTGPR